MPKRKVIDNKALVKMIKDQANQSDIMEKFGFKNTTQLKVAYANALMDTGEAPQIKGKGRVKKPKEVDSKVSVNGRGSLIIPKVLVESMNIKPGATFEVKKSTKGISLTKIAPEIEEPEKK
jgi:hypothetical protein